jgi:hypothetical protein
LTDLPEAELGQPDQDAAAELPRPVEMRERDRLPLQVPLCGGVCAENIGTDASTCGAQCHFQSQFQPVNYTTRNVGGGVQVDLGNFQVTWEHTFSSFNDRLQFPTETSQDFPEVEGISFVNQPPTWAPNCTNLPVDFPAGNYYLDPVSPSQASTDRSQHHRAKRFSRDTVAEYADRSAGIRGSDQRFAAGLSAAQPILLRDAQRHPKAAAGMESRSGLFLPAQQSHDIYGVPKR